MDKNLRSFAFLAGAFCAALSATGCTTHQCDPSDVWLGADAGGTGFWIADGCESATSNCSLVWHSTSTMDSNWTDFPGEATLTFTYPPLPPLPAGLVPDFTNITPLAYVSASTPLPEASTFNTTLAAGQLAEFKQPWSSSAITVLNASCQGSQLLLQVIVPVVVSDGGPPATSADGSDVGDSDVGDSTVSE